MLSEHQHSCQRNREPLVEDDILGVVPVLNPLRQPRIIFAKHHLCSVHFAAAASVVKSSTSQYTSGTKQQKKNRECVDGCKGETHRDLHHYTLVAQVPDDS